MAFQLADGDRIKVTLSGTVSAGAVYVGDSLAGIYLQSGVSGDVVPVALEGVFTVTTTAAGAASKFTAVLDKVYATSSGKASNTAGTPLGHTIEASASTSGGGESIKVRLGTF